MPLELFCIDKDNSRLIIHQKTVYKLKLVYSNLQAIQNVASHEETHSQIEQVLRAVLYMDQRETDFSVLKPIITKSFIVTVRKQYWKTSEKVEFKKNGENLKTCDHLFELSVKVRDSNVQKKLAKNILQAKVCNELSDGGTSSVCSKHNAKKPTSVTVSRDNREKLQERRHSFNEKSVCDKEKPKTMVQNSNKHLSDMETNSNPDNNRQELNIGTSKACKKVKDSQPVIEEKQLGKLRKSCCQPKNLHPGPSNLTPNESVVLQSESVEISDHELPRHRSLRKRHSTGNSNDSQTESEFETPSLSKRKNRITKSNVIQDSCSKTRPSQYQSSEMKSITRKSSRLSQKHKTQIGSQKQTSLRPRKEKQYECTDSQIESDMNNSQTDRDTDYSPVVIRRSRRRIIRSTESKPDTEDSESDSSPSRMEEQSKCKEKNEQPQKRKRKKSSFAIDDNVSVNNILGVSYKVQKFRQKLTQNQKSEELAVPKRRNHRLYNQGHELITSLPEVTQKTLSLRKTNSSKKSRARLSPKNNRPVDPDKRQRKDELTESEGSEKVTSVISQIQVKPLSKSKLCPTKRSSRTELCFQSTNQNCAMDKSNCLVTTNVDKLRKLSPRSGGGTPTKHRKENEKISNEMNTANTPLSVGVVDRGRKPTPGSDRILRSYRKEIHIEHSNEQFDSQHSPKNVVTSPAETETTKRHRSSLWNLVDTILTPVKRLIVGVSSDN